MSSRQLKIRGNQNGQPSKKGVPGILLKTMLSDYLSPSQIASLNVNWDKDYGMDNEVIRVFEEVQRVSKSNRKIMPFDCFRLVDKYLYVSGIAGLIGCVQLPDISPNLAHVLSKVEKIRNEIHHLQLKVKQKATLDAKMILLIFDYILEKTEREHRFLEIVVYELREDAKERKKVETVLDKLLAAVPKTDMQGHPGPQTHIVTVQQKLWPDRGYVISSELYEHQPLLKVFFESPIGKKFYQAFMEYLANHFPNMQEKMLDHVNWFTDQYFKWMVTMLNFAVCLPLEVAWKYLPYGHPICFHPGMPIQKLIVRMFYSREDGDVKRQFFFLDELRFVFTQLLRMGVETNGVGMKPPLADGSVPIVHRIAEVGSIDYMAEIMQNIFPRALEVIDIILVDMNMFSLTDKKTFPVLSPFNSHCVPAMDVFKRLVEILVGEVGVGRRIPFTFHPFVTLSKKMEAFFSTKSMFKLMVNRKEAHEMIKEASDLRGKFNGKLKTPKGKLGLLKEDATEDERMEAFVGTFRKFSHFHTRHLETSLSDSVQPTLPGAPSLIAIHNYLINATEQEDVAGTPCSA